jgi:ATP-dependent DNA helicase RecG
MYVENANRATREGSITPENLEPNPKNPIIASFFRSIGRADRLGSGVRKLFKYSKYYSGQEPQFMKGDVFRIVVPLDDSYSFEFGQNSHNGLLDQSNQCNLDRTPSFAKVNGKVAKKSGEKK